jgi:hypothetical protein
MFISRKILHLISRNMKSALRDNSTNRTRRDEKDDINCREGQDHHAYIKEGVMRRPAIVRGKQF